MHKRANAGWLIADFFAQSYRISGRVDVRQNRLADQLNDHTTSFIQLEDVYISNIGRPAHISASHTMSILRKQSISAAVVAEQEDGMPREQTYGSYAGTYLHKVFITIPSFEIQGDLHIAGRTDLRTLLATGTTEFVLLFNGKMKSALHPDTVFSGGAILVNKGHIGSFSLEKEKEE